MGNVLSRAAKAAEIPTDLTANETADHSTVSANLPTDLPPHEAEIKYTPLGPLPPIHSLPFSSPSSIYLQNAVNFISQTFENASARQEYYHKRGYLIDACVKELQESTDPNFREYIATLLQEEQSLFRKILEYASSSNEASDTSSTATDSAGTDSVGADSAYEDFSGIDKKPSGQLTPPPEKAKPFLPTTIGGVAKQLSSFLNNPPVDVVTNQSFLNPSSTPPASPPETPRSPPKDYSLFSCPSGFIYQPGSTSTTNSAPTTVTSQLAPPPPPPPEPAFVKLETPPFFYGSYPEH